MLEGFGCPYYGCNGYSLSLHTTQQFKWKAINGNLTKPYVCLANCKVNYKFIPGLNRCLRIRGRNPEEKKWVQKKLFFYDLFSMNSMQNN